MMVKVLSVRFHLTMAVTLATRETVGGMPPSLLRSSGRGYRKECDGLGTGGGYPHSSDRACYRSALVPREFVETKAEASIGIRDIQTGSLSEA